MNGELSRKRPAAIIVRTAGAELPRYEVVERGTRAEALAAVKRMARDGEIGSAYALTETRAGYAVKVVRIREPRRGGFRWPLLLALLSSVGLALLALWLLVKALAPFLPVLAVGAVVLVLLAKTGRRHHTINISQNVHMRYHG